jgi:S1-C subfamily serine protease
MKHGVRFYYRLWAWALPVLLGLTLGWFGMVCLGVRLDGDNRSNRSLSFSSVVSSADQDSDMANMTAFLNSNPFKVTSMVSPDPTMEEGEEDATRAENLDQGIVADPEKGTRGEIRRELLGIGGRPLEIPFEELRNIRVRPAEGGQGLLVQWINKDSILAQLGMQSGDVIRSINGIRFQNMMDITNTMSSLMNNGSFDIEILRDGEPVSLRYVVR